MDGGAIHVAGGDGRTGLIPMDGIYSEIIAALAGAFISGAVWFVRIQYRMRRDIDAAHAAIRSLRKGK
jgi:hypothetical protein